MIRQEREKCCDEMAIARFGASVKSYSTAIIDAVARARESARSVPPLAVAGSLKHIEERVNVMMTPGKKFYKHPSLIAATGSVLLALLIVPTALVLTTRAQTEAAVHAEEKPAKSLVEAVKAGDLLEVKRLVAQGADVTVTDGDKSLTPLGEAAHKGHAEIVKFLLANGAAVDKAADNYTPLYYAVWSGDEATVKALIAAGANVNVLPSEKDFPPLVFAIWEHDADIVRLLLDAGADTKVKTGANINIKNTDGFTPLYWAAVDGDREVLDLILARGNYADTIHLRACKGDVERVKALIEEGTAVDARDESGCTPLHWAACGDSPAVGDYLITKGADVNATDNLRLTPLMWAHGPPMMKLLIAKGADLHAKSERTGGRTRLQMACVAGETDIVNLLLSAGEDVNLKDERGGSLLAIAAWLGHTNVVELLIAKGADINVTDNEGRTPLKVARQQGQTGVVSLLLRHGAKD
jgi:ankyrin repeat protein